MKVEPKHLQMKLELSACADGIPTENTKSLEDSRTRAAPNDELSVCVDGNTFTWISQKTT